MSTLTNSNENNYSLVDSQTKERNRESEEENKEKERQDDEEQEEQQEEQEPEEPEEPEEQESRKENISKSAIELQLGDIIKIYDPTDDVLNDKIFMIEYIDNTKIKLIGEDELQQRIVKINTNGQLNNGSITQIDLLYRNDELGYAKQNNLLPGEWVNIYFEGTVPYSITGEITNLEEDMIELKTFPDNDIIYINFDYKGIPEDLPIKKIEIREAPETPEEEKIEGQVEPSAEMNLSEEEVLDLDEIQIENEPSVIPKIHKPLQPIVIDAADIEFGDQLAPIQEYITVDKSQFRYNIDVQTNDLLDDLLSRIPVSKRTTSVLNNLHIMIQRFIQLRQLGSVFDKNNNIVSVVTKTADYKPLVKELDSFKNKLYWLLLVAKNIKKIYDTTNSDNKTALNDTDESEISDILPSTTKESVQDISQLFVNYRQSNVPDSQNKYVNLYSRLNPEMTPFESINPENTQSIICEHDVESNINALIDNLDNFYSSVSEGGKLTSHRFVFQKYNTGLTRLHAINLKGSNMNTQRVTLTPNDIISIKSLVTLPEPTVRFSQINLPGSNILTKSNLSLHFLNYWQLLKEKTIVKDIDIDNLDIDFQFDENNFVDNIKNFKLSLIQGSDNLTQQELYNKFLNIVIPRTRILFNLVKKYIKGRLSMINLIGYLEPFLIYSNDLTFMQYQDINNFIKTSILNYNKKFIENKREFSTLKIPPVKTNIVQPDKSILFNMLYISPEIQHIMIDKYGYNSDYTVNVSNSEILKHINIADFGNLYNTGVAFENIALMFPTELNAIFDMDKNKLHNILIKDEEENTCTNYIIAKKYTTSQELLNDNGKNIYFDKEYDKTPYDILEKYSKERTKLTPEEFMIFLSEELQSQKYNYDAFTAEYMAETLTNGLKKVMDGQYAVVYDDEMPNEIMRYYVRRNNVWIEDTKIKNDILLKDNESLCLIQPTCITSNKHVDGDCDSLAMAKDTIVSNALNDILNEFDKNYAISKEELTNKLKKYLDKYATIFDKLLQLQDHRFYQYNNEKYEIGLSLLETEVLTKEQSPYIELRNLILGQGDFLKKQVDIIRFAKKFTRPPNTSNPNKADLELESPYWLYCVKTNTKLLPSFLLTLASVYIQNNPMYDQTMNDIINEQGVLSDDGGRWEDEHSGLEIRPIDWDIEEGYEDGFKIRSREVLEEDLGQTLANAQKIKKLLTPQSQSILNIINSMSHDMGINIDNQHEFIISTVGNLINDTNVLVKENVYLKHVEEMSKKGKKIPDYEMVYNSTFLYLILGTYLIAIQTSIPSVRTRKTFPGCVRSFNGFPLQGEGDNSALNYIACVASKKKSHTSPWNILSKEDKTAEKIKMFTVKYLLPNREVQQKIQDKIDYLLTNKEEDIPEEHSILKWSNFLPPLYKFKIRRLQNVTDGFIDTLMKDIRHGSYKQHDEILVIKSKIIEYSFAIQESIQNIIEKKDLLLKSSIHPYMDNACCNEKGSNTLTCLDYFIKIHPEIAQNNNIVYKLSNIITDIHFLTQSAIFLSSVNTKRTYPEISSHFNEETIYSAFINYCKFNSFTPTPVNLLALCNSKPEYISNTQSLTEQIAKLKRNGVQYTEKNMIHLLELVSRENIINTNENYLQVSHIKRFTNLLEKIKDDPEQDTINAKLCELLEDIADTFDLSVSQDTSEMRDLKNFLSKNNQNMKLQILEFMKQKGKFRKAEYDKISNFINNLTTWEFDNSKRNAYIKIADDVMYNYIQFFKNSIQQIVKVFPNMILNNTKQTINPPNYWGLSSTHIKDIKQMVDSFYEPLKPFYGDAILTKILNKIQNKCQHIISLSEKTPTISNIVLDDVVSYSVFDKQITTSLYEYYFLLVLIIYIELSNNDKMINIVASEEMPEEITTENEYIKGSLNQQKEQTAKLLYGFISILEDTKYTIDVSYDTVMEKVFKLKEREKDAFTDRLKKLTDEERNADTILKMNKLGEYNKGLLKSLKEYDPDNYDGERELMNKIATIEKRVRTNNADVDDDNVDLYMYDALEEMDVAEGIDEENNDLGYMNDDYENGDVGDEQEDQEYYY